MGTPKSEISTWEELLDLWSCAKVAVATISGFGVGCYYGCDNTPNCLSVR
jgi:hypothetical protein